MEGKKTAARVKILKEYFEPKTKQNVNLVEFYGDWYKFNGQEIDVFVVSESWLDKAKTIKDFTYGYESEDGKVRFIPKKHCEIVYQFL